jgi:hypothetical protein
MTKAKRNRSRSCDPSLNTGVKPDPIIPRRPTDMSRQIKNPIDSEFRIISFLKLFNSFDEAYAGERE